MSFSMRPAPMFCARLCWCRFHEFDAIDWERFPAPSPASPVGKFTRRTAAGGVDRPAFVGPAIELAPVYGCDGKPRNREEQIERRTFTDLGVDTETSPSPVHHGLHLWDAKAGPFLTFGREERVEDSGHDLRWNPQTTVLDPDADVAKTIAGNVIRADGDIPTLRHRVAGVDHQIDHRGIEKLWINRTIREVRSEFEIHTDCAARTIFEEHAEFAEEHIHV